MSVWALCVVAAFVVFVVVLALVDFCWHDRRDRRDERPESARLLSRTWLEVAYDTDDVIREVVDAHSGALNAAWQRRKAEHAAEVRRYVEERAEREREERRLRLETAARIADPVVRAASYRSAHASASEVLELEQAREGGGCDELMALAERPSVLRQQGGFRAIKNAKGQEALLYTDVRHEIREQIDRRGFPEWCHLCDSGDTKHSAHRDLTSDLRQVWAS